ncbi:MAG TPA: FAD-dependent oxidoreductase, partial [Gaiellales bacterium]|nr:FAD-dependent oxidoreductase [Gaiellales bacterium]
MRDVIVVGGGVIGACTAWQLAERGADVLLLERGALAGGATCRSQGLLLDPDRAEMWPLFAESNRLYDELAAACEVRLSLDRDPIGTLFVASSPAQLELLAQACPPVGQLLDRDAVLAAEPSLAAHVAGGLLLPGGRRSDPTALTVAAAERARAAGAEIRCHVDVKQLSRGAAVTDAGVERARTTVLAAGAWSRRLARTAGHELPVRPVRGWLAVTAPQPPFLRHVVYEAAYNPPTGPQPGQPVSLSDLATGDLATAGAGSAHAVSVHQNGDGTIMVGASRSAALREGDESAAALRVNAERACRLLPPLAAAEVAVTWSGLRPFSADGLPYIGRLDDHLVACAGHGSEGILSGAGSGRLAAELALGLAPHTDP